MRALGTCGEPNEIKKNTHPIDITSFFPDHVLLEGEVPEVLGDGVLPHALGPRPLIEARVGVQPVVRHAPCCLEVLGAYTTQHDGQCKFC